MQVAIDLPNDLVAFQSAADIRQEVRASYALWLYQRERVTLAKAAEVSRVSLYDVMRLCKSNQIPVIYPAVKPPSHAHEVARHETLRRT